MSQPNVTCVQSATEWTDFLSQRPIELKALSVQEALHVKEVTSIAEKVQSSVANRAFLPNSSSIALKDTNMYHLETKVTNYMNDSVIQKQSGEKSAKHRCHRRNGFNQKLMIFIKQNNKNMRNQAGKPSTETFLIAIRKMALVKTRR